MAARVTHQHGGHRHPLRRFDEGSALAEEPREQRIEDDSDGAVGEHPPPPIRRELKERCEQECQASRQTSGHSPNAHGVTADVGPHFFCQVDHRQGGYRARGGAGNCLKDGEPDHARHERRGNVGAKQRQQSGKQRTPPPQPVTPQGEGNCGEAAETNDGEDPAGICLAETQIGTGKGQCHHEKTSGEGLDEAGSTHEGGDPSVGAVEAVAHATSLPVSTAASVFNSTTPEAVRAPRINTSDRKSPICNGGSPVTATT